MVKIAIVDDHKLFRNGLGSILTEQGDFEVNATFEDGEQFLAAVEEGYEPSIVLLDISMPKVSGFEVLELLRKKKSPIKVIMLSMHEDGQYIQKSVRLGAKSYLLKNTDEDELLKAIQEVRKDKKYFPFNITELMLHNMEVEGNEPQKLSPREKEVLKLVTEGKTTKEIAELLFISTRTVETHRNNMMKKLEATNTAELIAKALQLNLI